MKQQDTVDPADRIKRDPVPPPIGGPWTKRPDGSYAPPGAAHSRDIVPDRVLDGIVSQYGLGAVLHSLARLVRARVVNSYGEEGRRERIASELERQAGMARVDWSGRVDAEKPAVQP